MGTHGYFNSHRYPHSGYPRGYGAGTEMIFIQRGGHGYPTIRTHGYPLTSLLKPMRRSQPTRLFHYVGEPYDLSTTLNTFICSIWNF